MKVNSTYVREKLAEMWPDLDIVILVDKDFILPRVDEIIEMFNASKIHLMQMIPQFNDCDDSAFHFVGQTRIKRYKMYEDGLLKPEDLFPWALGIATCTQSRGIMSTHAVALAICEEGIYIFDKYPDSNRYWKAKKEMDTPIILYM